MTNFDELTNELSASLNALDKPCGCQGEAVTENPFAEFSVSDDLETELAFALDSLGGEGAFSDFQLSDAEAMAFASLADDSGNGLENIISLLEKYPGLKITFSY